MKRRTSWTIRVALLAACVTAGAGVQVRAADDEAVERAPAALPALFDPARHMRVSEVRPGMKGYGLSVFSGTKIERFDVEVVSILKNFNARNDGLGPAADVVLVRCAGQNLEHTGGIAGMSGSPIFLKDDQGRERMIGAFAYGWPMAKDPVGGVQPIEYMLSLGTQSRVPSTGPSTRPTTRDVNLGAGQEPADSVRAGSLGAGVRPATWSYPEYVRELKQRFHAGAQRGAAATPFQAGTVRLQPLSTPVATSGMSSRLLDEFSGVMSGYGMVPLQAAGSGAASGAAAAALEPGSVLAVPLLTGDMDLTAIGTCTEVLGDHVYGFGHSFNNEGAVSLPMGSGEIHAVIANLMTSFKMGSLTKLRGTLNSDQIVGIAGQIGAPPGMIPFNLRVMYADGTEDRTYKLQAAAHPRLTPLVGAMAVAAAVSATRELPQYHTLDYDLTLNFANGQSVHLQNEMVNTSAPELLFAIGLPMIAAADNPFERVMVKDVTGTVRITPEAREAKILSVQVPKQRYKAGETVKAYVTYRPFRAAEAILPIELELPRDLPEGPYQLEISDWQKFLDDEQASKPFRFTAQNGREVFAVLQELSHYRRDAVYVRLMREEDGVAVGRTAMPLMPSSRRQVMLGSGRSDVTAFVSSKTKTVRTGHVMEGSASFEITVESGSHVETPGGKAPKEKRGGAAGAIPGLPRHERSPRGEPGKEKPSPPPPSGVPGVEEPG